MRSVLLGGKRHAQVEAEAEAAEDRTDSSQQRAELIEHEQLDAYSIALFCVRHGISERFYFKLKAAGRGPVEMQLGNRVPISREAAARWRAEREAESARR